MYHERRNISVGSGSRSPSPAPVVFIIDPDPSLRESLEVLIDSAGWRPLSFASAEGFLARPRLLAPGCLVLNVALGDSSGLELQRLLADRTELPIIFIADFPHVPTAVQAMKAGAFEFLARPLCDQVLLNALESALEHSRKALLEEAATEVLRGRYTSLSQREVEVMTLVVRGLLNKQVARDLSITETTVKAHRGQVMRKMGADSLPELVRMAARLGLATGTGWTKSHQSAVHGTSHRGQWLPPLHQPTAYFAASS